MTAFAALTLSLDAVPTTEVLSPQSIDGSGVARWLGTAASLDAKKSLSMSVTLPKPNGTVSRIKQRFTIPVIDGVTGLKTGESTVVIEAVIPKVASATDRAALRYAAMDLLAEAPTVAAYLSLESVY